MKIQKLIEEWNAQLHPPYVQLETYWKKEGRFYVMLNHYGEEICRDTSVNAIQTKLFFYFSTGLNYETT